MGRSSFARYGQAIGVLRGCVFVMCSAKRCVRPSGVRVRPAECVFVSDHFRFRISFSGTCPETLHCGNDDDASRSTSAACLRFFWEDARTSQHGEVRLKLLEQLERIVVAFAELQRLGGELEGLLEVSELIGEQRAVEERLE